MTKENVLKAKKECKELLERIKELEKRMSEDDYILYDNGQRIAGCKETSAVRRKSMDLTRSLAEMRKS